MNVNFICSRCSMFFHSPSKLRKLQDSIADPKYDGVKISRKQLTEADDMHSESGDEEEYGDGSGSEGGFGQMDEGVEDDEDTPSSGSDIEEDGDEKGLTENSDQEERDAVVRHSSVKEADEMTSALRRKQEDDRRKGIAVSKQISIWDSLLDARIRLQKSMSSANTLPNTADYISSPEYQQSLTKMLEEAALLSEDLIELRESLMEVNEAIEIPPRKKRRLESESSISGYETYLRDTSQVTSDLEHAYHPHLIQTLSKWSSKIQAVAPSVLLPSNRNAFSKDRSALKSAGQLVDETLEGHEKLLSRTRIWRGKEPRIGVSSEEGGNQEDIEVFDDTDFYQQLLRDVIDSRGASGGDDWMTIQKQKKAKKKVDTKASKGRKLRYEVHEKLQHFMAPVVVRGTWHEEQIDELFASLLGKGFENATEQVESALSAPDIVSQEVPVGGLEGFRVFG
ncbi:TRAUB-domain-containing protein [Dendrothele bispora CBS 962.96]|uniref:Protein BFR2 n=1 Tax=Dendrothele bispora (strain CBS 962.96) TaxID=1314807 RepID=A0A4S8LQ60_DENBC|nr:TRAUB-domain-containing protein [Dendrothele bispora CBS 962.96]